MKKINISILGLILYLTSTLISSPLDWKHIETDHYVIYYPEQYETQAQETLIKLEKATPTVEKVTGGTVKKVPILLEDYGQLANGFVSVMPLKMNLMTYQDPQVSFHQYQNYPRMLATHELVHAAHLTTVSGTSKTLSDIFGSTMYPHIYTPLWYKEGLAVLVESSQSPYEGRLNDASVYAYFKSAAKAKKLKSLGDVTTHLDYVFPYGKTPYIYGGKFLEYLTKTYGTDTLSKLNIEHSKTFMGYGTLYYPKHSFDKEAKSIFGKPFEELYNEWRSAEEKNSESWITIGTHIPLDGQIKNYLLNYNGNLYLQQNSYIHPSPHYYPQKPYIATYSPETQTWENIIQLYQSTSQPFEIHNDTLYITFTDITDGYDNISFSGFGYIKELVKIDLKTKNKTSLFKDTIDAFTIADDTIIYAQNIPWKPQSNIYIKENNVKKALTHVDLSIFELVESDDTIYGIGKNTSSQWALFSLDSKTLKSKELFASPWNLSHLVISEGKAIFTINKATTMETHAVDLTNQNYSKLSSGSYANAGTPINNTLYFTNIEYDGMHLYHQEITETPLTRPSLTNTTYSAPKSTPENPLTPGTQTLSRSNKSLLKPYLRYGIINLGQDDLQLTDYTVGFYSGAGIQAAVFLKHFLPYTLSYSFNQNEQIIGVSRPVYYTKSPGIKYVSVGGNYSTENDISLTVYSDYGWIDNSGTILLDQSPDDSSYKLDIYHLYYKTKTALSLGTTFVNNNTINDSLRGLSSTSVSNEKGYNTSIDLTYKALDHNPKYAKWNPIARFGDTFVGSFIDYSSFKEQSSIGYYVKVQKISSSLKINSTTTLGQSFSKGKTYFFFEINFY